MKHRVIFIFSIISVLECAGPCLAVQVDGHCYLQNQSIHSNSKVLFEATSPSAVTDSTYTDSVGYYNIELSQGVYDIFFTHQGYYDEEILNRLFMNNTTLQNITLIPIIQNELSGALSGVLPADSYRIVGDIFVQSGDSLYILPGTVFQFDGPYAFDIYGYLSAVGTESDSIKFILTPTVTGWAGIDFNETSSDSSILRYCYVTDSDSNGIYCNRCSPTIDHCTITGNSASYDSWYGGGIRLDSSNAVITNCIIANNSLPDAGYGGGIFIGSYSTAIIKNCTISNNTNLLDGHGIGICCWIQSHPIIENCIISDNTTMHDGQGGGIYCIESSPTFTYCDIFRNSSGDVGSGGGIYLISSTAMINHCVVRENIASEPQFPGNGGAVFCNDSSPTLVNCVIIANSPGSATGNGGGIYCFGSDDPVIVNSIVANNLGGGGINFDSPSESARITYSNFYGNLGGNFTGAYIPQYLGNIISVNHNGDSCDIYYNIFLNPQFVNPSSGDYHLQSSSPCIDAGDPTSPLDPDSTIADIGVFYFDQLGVINHPNPIQPTSYALLPPYPNPFNSVLIIPFTIPIEKEVTINIYNILGQKVQEFTFPSLSPGVHRVVWNSGSCASGLYVIRLISDGKEFKQKVILLK
jgi:hypothetical protein